MGGSWEISLGSAPNWAMDLWAQECEKLDSSPAADQDGTQLQERAQPLDLYAV